MLVAPALLLGQLWSANGVFISTIGRDQSDNIFPGLMLDINVHLLVEIVLMLAISKVISEADVKRIMELRVEISLVHEVVQVYEFVAITD